MSSIQLPGNGKGSQVAEHHDDSHNLATFIGVGVALGAGVGAALGTALGNIAMGVGIGPAFGIAISVAVWCARQTPTDRGDREE
jgi:hypothetical protein